ncbi:MAG: YggS family pyridoxal phosphate-dependent enzyme [Bacteroidaceae bacterium]|nr:YggS family pyridoxal phosphate-dependent enzyme [Bacteroidaceae bacterium]
MNTIGERLNAIKSSMPPEICLVAVSKFHSVESIREAYIAGQRVFGESKAQELVQKKAELPNDIQWHFIGHLQSNKIKYIAPFISMIHSIDSFKLLSEVNKVAARENRIIRCLLQIHVAEEETKFGFSPNECIDMLRGGAWRDLRNVSICGIMGMASFTDNQAQIMEEFNSLSSLFHILKEEFFTDNVAFKEISMGMSHDYPLAVKAGSTMVRVGSSIFGERVY